MSSVFFLECCSCAHGMSLRMCHLNQGKTIGDEQLTCEFFDNNVVHNQHIGDLGFDSVALATIRKVSSSLLQHQVSF